MFTSVLLLTKNQQRQCDIITGMWYCPRERAVKIFGAITRPFRNTFGFLKNEELENLSKHNLFLNEDIKYLMRKGYLTGERVNYGKVAPDFIGQEYGNLEITPEGMNYWEEKSTDLEDSLHPSIQEHCLPLYENNQYSDSAKKAFHLVRSAYKAKFGSEAVPESFSSIYYVSGTSGIPGSDEDKQFQDGCERILRSVNNFRNEKEHTDPMINMSKDDAIHYLFLSSMALRLLEKSEAHRNNLHPFNKSDYRNDKRSGCISFDYSNNNGEYQIGSGPYTFTIKVGEYGDGSLYIYNDPENIEGVGLMDTAYENLKNVKKECIEGVDMSSGSRVIRLNNTGVLLNKNNIYALLKLKKATRSDNGSHVEIEYYILK